MKAKWYPIAESFYSFQGEGVHMGQAAFFVRLYGCDQKCSFCDSAGTWHPEHVPAGIARLSAAEVADLVPDVLDRFDERPFVVLTGGEPTLYDLQPLVEAIKARGLRVHIETAGHHKIPNDVWVTMSPKFFAHKPLDENWERADEIKLVCTSPEQMRLDVTRILTKLEERRRFWPAIWLHPEWSQARSPELLRAIVEEVKSNPRLRAGFQLHKLYRADSFDPNSLPDVPLGGVFPNPIIPLHSGNERDNSTGTGSAPTPQELEDAVRTLLQGIGEDVEREGLLDTPRRVVKALREMTRGKEDDPAALLARTFEEDHTEAITVGPIRFTSLCEHHLLPFVGEAFVSYVPDGRVVGLSKIPRLVQCFARRPQLQERLTDQIARAMWDHLSPRGVAVRVKAHHSCMGCRGVEQKDAQMWTQAFLGQFTQSETARRDFLLDAR